MQEIGQELKQAREEQGLTLEALASRTMIAKKYLQALEDGDFERFPGEVYLKGALRKYATEVGLDPVPLLNRYSGADSPTQEDPPKEKPAPKVTGAPTTVTTSYVSSVRRLNKGRLAMLILVLALLFVGVRAIGMMIADPAPDNNEPPPVEDELLPEGEDNEAEEEEPVEEEPEEPQLRFEAEDIQGGTRYTVYNADSLEAEMSFSGRCWVRAHTDGTQAFETTFTAGQGRTITAEREMSIRFGAASTAQLEVNGEAIDLPQTGNAYNVEIVLAHE